MDEFRKICHMYNFDLSDQELISVMRKFDKNYDGVVKYNEFCDAVLEEDYTKVEAHEGGQVLHGENVYTSAENKIEQGKFLEEENSRRQERLMQMVNAMRVHLHDKREPIAQIFQQADEHQDGQVSTECFVSILEKLKEMLGKAVEDGVLSFDNEEVNLMLESFSDPEFPDQTRPMSIAVLDQALFA